MNLEVLQEGCSPEDFMWGWSHTDVFCVSAQPLTDFGLRVDSETHTGHLGLGSQAQA